MVLCRGDDHFVPDLASPWAMHLHREYDDPSPKSLGGWAAAVSSYSSVGGGAPEQKRAKVEEPHLLHVVASREELDVMRVPLEALCGARVKSARSLPTCLTLLHPSCSKADGLIPALKELGVEACDVHSRQVYYPSSIGESLCEISTALSTPLRCKLTVDRSSYIGDRRWESMRCHFH